ncbi:MAG: hypothetical protein HYW78_02505 [Parcubacteria group bacterium]|nr:hypothetical protein [Parcubacteria group bacterium]
MPEIMLTPPKLTEELQNKKDSTGYLSLDRILELVKKYDRKLIGRGSECVVISTPHKEKIIALPSTPLSPLEAKKSFYFQRIFSTLFPHNFPHFYAAFGNHENKYGVSSGTVRKMIKGQQSLDGKPKVQYPFKKVLDICSSLKIPLRFDHTDCNFLIGKDGGEYYVDNLMYNAINGINGIAPKKDAILAYMDKMKYSEIDKQIVKTSIERLLKALEEDNK